MMTTGDQTPPTPQQYEAMGKYVEKGFREGYLIATGGLDAKATRITSQGGRISVTDGPFAEAKEAVVGFALVEVSSKEQAIELSKEFWSIVGDGQGEIRQVFGPEGPTNGR
jgi:hypothetical protein